MRQRAHKAAHAARHLPACQLSASSASGSAAPPFHCLRCCLTDRCRLSRLQGFQRVADNLGDTELDNPAARERFEALVKAAVAGERRAGRAEG